MKMQTIFIALAISAIAGLTACSPGESAKLHSAPPPESLVSTPGRKLDTQPATVDPWQRKNKK